MLQISYKEAARMLQTCCKEVAKMLQIGCKYVANMLQISYRLQRCCKDAAKNRLQIVADCRLLRSRPETADLDSRLDRKADRIRQKSVGLVHYFGVRVSLVTNVITQGMQHRVVGSSV